MVCVGSGAILVICLPNLTTKDLKTKSLGDFSLRKFKKEDNSNI